MSEIPSQVTPRLISFSTLFRSRLLPATLSAIVASILLAAAILTAGAIISVCLGQTTSAETAGLAGVAERMGDGALKSIALSVANSHTLWQHDRSTVALLFLLTSILLLMRWGLNHFSEGSVADFVEDETQRLRQHIHRKAIRLEPADVSGDQAVLADRLFREATSSLQSASLHQGRLLLAAIPDALAVLITAVLVNWRVGLETMIPVVVCWFGMRAESQRTDATSRLLAEQVGRGLSRLAEGLRKTRLVAGYSMEELEQQQFQQNLAQYRDRCTQLRRQREAGRWICRLIALLCVALPGYLIARHLLTTSELRAGGAFVLAACGILIYRVLVSLQRSPGLATEGSVRVDEIASYVARVPSVGQMVGARFFEPMSRSLLFDQICLRTPQHPRLLLNLDLKVNFGDRIALLSINPLAARALASMVPRFLDPDSGQILLDGADIRSATLESLRAECILVGGSDPVFNASVLENISCGHADVSRQQAIEAAKAVHADHFIRHLPKSYDTLVGEHGVPLDAGQVFRLSLARAVVRNPAILIIEEPAVAMDNETKAMIDDAYQRIWGGRTVIFLPARLSTVKRCTRVVVIHEGKVVADAPHDKLVRTSDVYRHWEYVRFNAFREEPQPQTP